MLRQNKQLFGLKFMIYIHPKTQVLIFDCDGTIADNMTIHNQAWQTIAKRYQINVSPDELAHYNGIPTINVLQKLTKNMDLGTDLTAIVDEKEALTHQSIHLASPIMPVVDIIKHYHNRLPMVVISGGTAENVTKTLSTLNIDHLFEWIITADDDHPTKDSPSAFTRIAEKFGVEPNRCQVFEDGKPGLINAIKANMVVTDVRTFYP